MAMTQVICTGKGTHRQVTMPQFFLLFTSADWVNYDGWLEIEDGTPSTVKESYTFTCRRCTPTRPTRMTRKTLLSVLDGLRAAGYVTLDISRLPF
jgi:hypothetical protein